jgi:hypothetical protein
MALPVYSSRKVQVSWAGSNLSGLAPDSFVTFSRNSPITEAETGADGKINISYLPDESGTCTIETQQNGEANWILSAVLASQEAKRTPIVGSLTIADPSGAVLALLTNCHIQESPEISLSSSASGNTFSWTFFCERIRFASTPEEVSGDFVQSDLDRIAGLADTIINSDLLNV